MTWIAVTKNQLDDAEAMTVALVDALVNPREPSAETLAYLAKRDALYSDDVSDLSEDEAAAARALYDDPDIEVGAEGIGGFYAGQAEATIRTLRKAGFTVQRIHDGETDPTGHTDGCTPGVVHRAADGSGNCPCFCHRWNGPET